MTMKQECPICKKRQSDPVFEMNGLPILVNRVCKTEEIAHSVPVQKMELFCCPSCGYVWNHAFQPDMVHYDTLYENSQDFGEGYQIHREEMLRFLQQNVPLSEKKVLEIGCGKGRFLHALAERTNCYAVGVDPSYLENEENHNGRCQFFAQYFTAQTRKALGGPFTLVILRQVLDQIEDIYDMMQNIVEILAPGGFLFVEGLNLAWILEQSTLFDFSYERCSYWTPDSLCNFMLQFGVRQVAVKNSFGGQYMAVLGQKQDAQQVPPVASGSSMKLGALLRQLEQKKTQLFSSLQAAIKTQAGNGSFCIWGAANKGVMLCNLLDPKREWIDCVIDILPEKQGCFIPGSGHPILSERALIDRHCAAVLIVNSNYSQEIRYMIGEMGITPVILELEDLLQQCGI